MSFEDESDKQDEITLSEEIADLRVLIEEARELVRVKRELITVPKNIAGAVNDNIREDVRRRLNVLEAACIQTEQFLAGTDQKILLVRRERATLKQSVEDLLQILGGLGM